MARERRFLPFSPLLLTIIGVFFFAVHLTCAQNPPPTPLGGPASVPGFKVNEYGSVVIFLRTQDGHKLPEQALPSIRISAEVSNTTLPNQPQMTGDGWMVTGLPIGNDYYVTVTANGYQPARQTFDIPQVENAVTNVIVFMRPIDESLIFRPPGGNFVLAPKAQKEIQHALQDLQQGNISSARKHCEKALQLAPGNPYVHYVTGMAYLLSKDLQSAKPYLEKSVSLDPTQPVALAALGGLLYDLSDDEGAIEALNKAVQLDPSLWKSEWFLACSYFRQKKFKDSKEHAQQALKIGKEKASLAEVVLGEAEANLGERDAAIATLQDFATKNPADPNAKDAVRWIEILRRPPEPASSSPTKDPSSRPLSPADFAVALPLPTIEVPPRADWAPPDIDAAKPFVISGATCPLDAVLKSAGANAEQFVSTLEEFSATEEFQAIELKQDGTLDKPNVQAYNYFVFVERITPKVFQVNEVREQGSQPAKLSGRISDMGVPGLALAFHPSIQENLEWTCEGLGKWNDRPAWVVHFQQRPDRPSVLAMFTTPSHEYSLALKGRAWIAEEGDQVVHLETDLVKDVQPANLKREHFAIDYKLVSFQKHNVDLWLPENVDTYIQYQGHFFHHYHHFSNFKLFWVGATQKIGDPKEANLPEQQPPTKEQQPR